jgi:excisionase family DNA binding protein
MSTLLTIKQVAALLNVSQRTIRRWIDAGDIAFIKLPGGLRIRQENLERWLDKRTTKTTL